MINTMRKTANLITPYIPSNMRTPIKEAFEYLYWKRRFWTEKGDLDNSHYQFLYTNYFNLDLDDYNGKRICDIGCGPRGSLEWADTAERRVGVDPLVSSYRKLGIARHRMEYISSPAENIPIEGEYFDFVCSFNSLDHVDNYVDAITKMARVLKRDGVFLLITEVNHKPTLTEPINIELSALRQRLASSFTLTQEKVYGVPENHKFYHKLMDGRGDLALDTRDTAIYTAFCVKDR